MLVYVFKGLMMAITGAILAYVTQQIRGRIVGLLEDRERQNQSLVSETRQVTVMFLDIRSFTTFSESRTPDQVVKLR